MVRINGEDYDVAGKTMAAFLEAENYPKTRIAVERNGDILPKAEYDSTILCDGDKIEIVSFVGGG